MRHINSNAEQEELTHGAGLGDILEQEAVDLANLLMLPVFKSYSFTQVGCSGGQGHRIGLDSKDIIEVVRRNAEVIEPCLMVARLQPHGRNGNSLRECRTRASDGTMQGAGANLNKNDAKKRSKWVLHGMAK